MNKKKKPFDILDWLAKNQYFEYAELLEAYLAAGYSEQDAKREMERILTNPKIRRHGKYYTALKP